MPTPARLHTSSRSNHAGTSGAVSPRVQYAAWYTEFQGWILPCTPPCPREINGTLEKGTILKGNRPWGIWVSNCYCQGYFRLLASTSTPTKLLPYKRDASPNYSDSITVPVLHSRQCLIDTAYVQVTSCGNCKFTVFFCFETRR